MPVAVVKQRLRLASVSPKLLYVYAEDGMTLDVAFCGSSGEASATRHRKQRMELVEVASQTYDSVT